MKRAGMAVVLTAIGGLSLGAVNVQQQQSSTLPTLRPMQKLRDNLYFVSGGDTYERATWTGGNTLVFVTDSGVILVDTMLAGAGRGLLAQIKGVTNTPVTTIINTHTHFDHSGSNIEFPSTVEFIAQENTKANMAKASCPPVTNCDAFKGANARYLPRRTFKDRMSLFSGKDQIDLYYFGRGHTNGDTFVVFPGLRAMHAGDMFPRAHMPFIDVANNSGSAVEFSATLQQAVSTIKNVDIVVGGHTPTPVTWADFRTYTDFYKEFLLSAQAAIKQGTRVDEFVKNYRLPERYSGFKADPAQVKANAEAIWKESGK